MSKASKDKASGRKSKGQKAQLTTDTSDLSPMKKKRLMFVDDELHVLEGLRRTLKERRHEWDMTFVTNPYEALVELQETSYEVLILDIHIGKTNGWDFMAQLQEESKRAAPQIIMLTGGQDPSLRARAIELGAMDLLIKPVKKEDLVARITNALQIKAYQNDLYAQKEQHEGKVWRLNMLSESLPVGTFEVDGEGNCIYKNPTWDDIFGRTNDQIFSFAASESPHGFWLDWFHPDDKPILSEEWDRCKGFYRKISRECRLDPTMGQERWVRVLLRPMGSDQGVRFLGTVEDISERKKAEENLRQAHDKNEKILESIAAILISVDHQDHIIEWNKQAETTFGLLAAKVMGKSFFECPITWDWAEVRRGVESCHQQQTLIKLDNVGYHQLDGKEGVLSVTLNPIEGKREGRGGVLLLAEDVTEHRMMERKLLQTQKLESIGRLTAGVAHEINTPIQYVGDNTRFLNESFADLQKVLSACTGLVEASQGGTVSAEGVRDMAAAVEDADLAYLVEEIPKAIAQSLEGVERVAAIVRAMKEFSHPGVEGKAAIDLNQAIDSTLIVARNEWKYVADMETDFDSSLPLVHCHPGEFNQVILNLVVNAAQAIGDVVGQGETKKGRILVRTRRLGECVEIRIGDTGSGIPEEIRSKIFDPFFTTKEVGKGTGQGLAIAHAVVVETHGGAMTVETEMGKGTTFIITLPLNPKEAPQP